MDNPLHFLYMKSSVQMHIKVKNGFEIVTHNWTANDQIIYVLLYICTKSHADSNMKIYHLVVETTNSIAYL